MFCTACTAWLSRVALDHVVEHSMVLVEHLNRLGPDAVVDMENLLLQEAMDVIGAPPLSTITQSIT